MRVITNEEGRRQRYWTLIEDLHQIHKFIRHFATVLCEFRFWTGRTGSLKQTSVAYMFFISHISRVIPIKVWKITFKSKLACSYNTHHLVSLPSRVGFRALTGVHAIGLNIYCVHSWEPSTNPCSYLRHILVSILYSSPRLNGGLDTKKVAPWCKKSHKQNNSTHSSFHVYINRRFHSHRRKLFTPS